MNSRIAARLGLEHPIIQAPMAGVSTAALAAAVSAAGGLGSLALGALNADQARDLILDARKRHPGPYAANVFVHPTPERMPVVEARYLEALAANLSVSGAEPPAALDEIYLSFNDDDAMLEVLLGARPEAVSLHFGLADADRMAALKSAGIFVLATATSVPEAEALAAAGCDAIVAQSHGAGGHSGAFLGPPDPATGQRKGLLALIAATAKAVDVPVVAAGGLMTGADIRMALEAGADAVQLGTAFVACPESHCSDAYRRRLLSAPETRLTAAISGRPARGIVNPLMTLCESFGPELPDYPLTYDGSKQLIAARSDPEFAVMWAGEGVAAARSQPAAALMATLVQELHE